MRRLLAALLVAIGITGFGAGAQAQDAATLIADRVNISRAGQLVADGTVEVLHKGARLKARRISYDRASGQLTIEGPLVLTDDAGTAVLADAADLSDDLREGILQSARIVLDRQLQIAANEVQRLGGRYTAMSRAVASSCRVCEERQTPLWEIRARRVVHDQQERQIWFDNAQLRFAGVPVMWFPWLRMPDPTLKRTSGFLMPRLVTTSQLGTGLHVPYFIALGRSRDLTLTPFLASKDVQSLAIRYRQAFRRGEIGLTGALSFDRLQPRRRGWLGAEGRFELPAGFSLQFAGEMVSDPGYFRDYGLSDRDRLESQLLITRTRAGEHIGARLVHVHSIRAGEVNSELPQLASDIGWTRRMAMPGIGGTLTLDLAAHAHRRASILDGDRGRDVARTSGALHWRRDWVLPAGVLTAVETGASFDIHRVSQDVRWPTTVQTWTPSALIEARWPLHRITAAGASEVLEPVVQLVWSREHAAGNAPNEDSTLVAFDEGNLFARSRFAGVDRREGGTRINLGIGWTRIAPDGWTTSAQVGRVIRISGQGQFTAASGLAGRRSDWLAALHMAAPEGFAFEGRAVFDDKFDFSRAELRLGLDRDRYGLTSGVLWAAADPAENRLADTAEWVVDGRLRLSTGWTAKASGRYDWKARRATTAGLGLEFANECLRVDLSLSRRFTSSTSVRPTTDFGLSVDLIGFGSSRPAGPAGQSCR